MIDSKRIKKETIIEITAGLIAIISLLFLLLHVFVLNKNFIDSDVLYYREHDYFYYNNEAWRITYLPANVLNPGSAPSLRVLNVANENETTVISVADCLDFCNYEKFKIKVDKISDSAVHYSVYLK